MKGAIRHRFRIWARRLDGRLEAKANLLLPASLTKRYALGFGLVALMVCLAQLFEQASFSLQAHAFRQSGRIDHQSEASLEFSRAVEQIRAPAGKGLLEDRLQVARSSLQELAVRQDLLTGDTHLLFTAFASRRGLEDLFSRTSELLAEMEHGFGGLSLAASRSFSRPQIREPYVAGLLEKEHQYRNALSELNRFYQQRIMSRIVMGRALSLSSTILVMLLLLCTGLYVIRPGVRQLLDAVEARSRFLGRVGNEIRNPLNSILGMTSLIEGTSLTEQQRHYIAALGSASKSLMGHLNNLIDYSRISSGKVMLEYCEIDLLNAVHDCIDLITYKADRKEIDLFLNVDPKTPIKITTDPLVLQQVLLNLLENAVKFTERGKITLSVWHTRDFGRSRLHFAISDTGSGISPPKLSEIFSYFREKDPSALRRFGGSGLGLGICLELIKLTGGEIDVQSQKGKGSTFHFFLPVNRFSEDTFFDLFRRRSLAGKRALLLEGNPDRREKIQTYIECYGGTSVVPPGMGAEPPWTEERWAAYFASEAFELCILSHELQGHLVGALQQAEEMTKRPLLPKVVMLLRSNLPPSRLLRLNSLGVKTFCYIPIKPVEFLTAIDLVLRQKEEARPPLGRRTGHYSLRLSRFQISRPISALVVDDSRDNQVLMKNYLEKHTSHLVLADNGQEAMEKFRQNNFDIVFMDLMMPELDGYDATRQMREFEAKTGRKSVPIVAVSAHTDTEEVEKCRSSGFTAHLSKPLDLGELQSFLGKVFGETAHSEENRQDDMDENWKKKMQEYLPTYYRQRSEDLKKLREAAGSGDWEKLVFIGHKIKGSAATYGFPELGQAGAELEQYAQEKDMEQVNGRIQFIENWLKTVNL